LHPNENAGFCALQVLDAEVTNSILGDGCVVRAGTTIKHSVIGLRSLIGENCHIEDALIMGCGPPGHHG
jgi:glucose-1-phosphate adenylyltransferase